LLTTCISSFISFETCFATCWIILLLSNLTLRSEILYKMFSLWWDFEEVCASCAKSVRSCCLVLKLLEFNLYLVLNEKFQYDDLEALGCFPYPVVQPSVRSRYHLRKIMSNTMILMLWGVCRTQSCDSPCSLEIIKGFQMSTLLNLIAYSLTCLLTCTSRALSCIYEHLAKHASWIIVSHFEMISIFLYMLVLLEIEVLMLVVTLLKLQHCLISYLAPCYMFFYLLMVYLWGLTLIFAKSWHLVEYSLFKYLLI
jgi:hypothetical protein